LTIRSAAPQDSSMLPRPVPLAFLLCACAAHQPVGADVTLIGPVTTLTPNLCVGGVAATGTCFTGESTAQLASLTVGTCVDVTYAPDQANDRPARLTNLVVESAASARVGC
jgi:hypothetical protein